MLEQIDQMRQENFGAVADVEDEMHGGDKRGDLDFATKRKYNVTVSDAFEIGVKESLMIQPGLRRTKSKILDFFLLLFVIVGSVLIAYGGQQLWIAYQAESWPQTVGTVIASSVDYHRSRNSASYFPRVRYRYTVDGVQYEGHRIWVEEQGRSSRGWAQEVVARYQPGTMVTVFYDPSNPAFAVLVPGLFEGGAIIWVLVGVVFILFTAGFYWILAAKNPADPAGNGGALAQSADSWALNREATRRFFLVFTALWVLLSSSVAWEALQGRAAL